MPNRIHIVEHSRVTPNSSGDHVHLSAEWDCEHRTSWDRFVPEQMRNREDALLIANAVYETARAMDFFRWLADHPAPIPIFAILPEENNVLLKAAAETVDDFMVWPARSEEFHRRISRLLGRYSQTSADVPASLAAEMGLGLFVGRDPAFLRVMKLITLFSASDAPVLITGETGTGKEMCARVIHLVSKRQRGPFIPVDCGALPDHLFENEVFGHTRGAFTDARTDQKGLISLAEAGTLFLDEIDSLSLAAQSKVLRLLQEHSFRPLGSDTFKRANVRILAATNRNLEQLVEQKVFRQDLLFRVNVLEIRMPALRDRRSDVLRLARYFIEDICRNEGLPQKVLSTVAGNKLEHHDWPGNVRELYNTMQRAVLCSPGNQIAGATIQLDACARTNEHALCDFRSAKLKAIRQFEREYVMQMMEKNGGNVTRAAREAGQDRRAFGRLAKKHQLSGTMA